MNVDPEGATWRKSTYSNGSGGNCVEVADLPNGRAVRDSKHPQGPILVFATDQWHAFVQGIKAGIPALSLPATGSDEPARHASSVLHGRRMPALRMSVTSNGSRDLKAIRSYAGDTLDYDARRTPVDRERGSG